MNAGLIGIFIIYFFQGIALIALPIVNKRLYNSAKVRLPKWLLYLVGTLTAVPMGYFLIITIAEVFIFTFFGLIVGTVLYIWGRKQGKKEGFNYRARMEQDYHLLEQ